jgi:hypothetical protein
MKSNNNKPRHGNTPHIRTRQPDRVEGQHGEVKVWKLTPEKIEEVWNKADRKGNSETK